MRLSIRFCFLFILKIYLAVSVHLFAGLKHSLHYGLFLYAILKINTHLKGHKINGGVFNAFYLACGNLHFIGAAYTINVYFIGFGHWYQLLI